MSMISELTDRLRRYARWSKTTNPSWSGAMTEAADMIEELSAKLAAANMERSSAWYGNGWIPVEDRNPEKCGYYLATMEREIDGKKDTAVEKLWYMDGAWPGLYEYRVKAWMPLPEPWKEDPNE